MLNSTLDPFGEAASSSSSPGLVVGLTLFFVLVATVVGVVAFRCRSKIRNVVRSGRRRNSPEEAGDDARHYTDLIREQKIPQSPIYENLTAPTAGFGRLEENQSRSPEEPEEDLYLQCDPQDHAIYSNDPECGPALLRGSPEEDVYIIPDS